ncbi:hypothetical protein V1525DRAFT_425328 [Lipomyces kononenkoae]|uniref:Uncharacterized protein n=1 Tax=Lipomyces kononenkoae TaxID=34357 RepID=A0ACC3T718_LIPKO
MFVGIDGKAFKSCQRCRDNNDISVASCAQSGDQEVQRRAAGYFFHFRRTYERPDGERFSLNCSRSIERKTERGPQNILQYTAAKEFFECHEHNGHIKPPTYHMTADVKNYIKAQSRFPPQQIYQNLMQMADDPQFEKTHLHTITRQQVYNVWVSIARKESESDALNDFRSAQLLLGEQDGSRLFEQLQEPGVALADSTKFKREKMTEVFINSTFGTNKHGYELYCVLTEYDLVSLPLSYLPFDTVGIQEVGKRGSRLTEWFFALRCRKNPACHYHLCLRHSLQAIDKHVTDKVIARVFDSIDNARNSIQVTALPQYLHFSSDEETRKCSADETLRAMIKRHLLRHPLLPKAVCDETHAPQALVYETYEEIHASSVNEMLELFPLHLGIL